jgi:hypothetical protein
LKISRVDTRIRTEPEETSVIRYSTEMIANSCT